MVDSSLCPIDSCQASYSCSGHVLDSHDLVAMPDSQCLLSELKPSVLESRPTATSPPHVFGLSSDYFLNLHARIFASRAYNFIGLRCHRPFVCLFGEHIYKRTIMEFVTFWSSAGQLVSTNPVLFRYTLTFTIMRAPRNSPLLLMLICRPGLHATQFLVRLLIIRFRVL